MCKYCRHEDIRPAINKLRLDLDLDTVFLGDMKACLMAAEKMIRELKPLRKNQCRSGLPTYLIDAKLSALRFGAFVLNFSRKMEREGKDPWLNAYRENIGGRRGNIFL